MLREHLIRKRIDLAYRLHLKARSLEAELKPTDAAEKPKDFHVDGPSFPSGSVAKCAFTMR